MLGLFFKREEPDLDQSKASSERTLSPLHVRILAVNVMALAILVGGILYLGNYQDRIVATELKEMLSQARIVASAVAENAIVADKNDQHLLSPLLGRMMIRRLADATVNRTRLFNASETLLADSRNSMTKNGKAQADDVFGVEDDLFSTWGARSMAAVFDVIDLVRDRQVYPAYNDDAFVRGSPTNVTFKALKGDSATQVWRMSKGGLILAVAVPVEYNHRVLGAVMMSRSDATINQAVYSVRVNILQIFLMALGVTILLSFYLARAIAHPIRQLAQAAEILRRDQSDESGVSGGISNLLRDEVLPDMTSRNDEIGDLSGVLRGLTAALARRIGDIEHFAADVAHELKNPLTSLRSAVETFERVSEPSAQKKLMLIIRDDVDRMTRLITDISSASRLDAELGRAEFAPIDIITNLSQIESYYRLTSAKGGQPPRLELQTKGENLVVMGVIGRLSQVFQNLIDNALSFSPPDKTVMMWVSRVGRFIQIEVEDSGPGIPENKLDAVFDRFYSERPKTEKFGTHSGLGLSISKQIIDAHRGRIWAENRRDESGKIVGARFIVQLPSVSE